MIAGARVSVVLRDATWVTHPFSRLVARRGLTGRARPERRASGLLGPLVRLEQPIKEDAVPAR
jgi:hypothetical protein